MTAYQISSATATRFEAISQINPHCFESDAYRISWRDDNNAYLRDKGNGQSYRVSMSGKAISLYLETEDGWDTVNRLGPWGADTFCKRTNALFLENRVTFGVPADDWSADAPSPEPTGKAGTIAGREWRIGDDGALHLRTRKGRWICELYSLPNRYFEAINVRVDAFGKTPTPSVPSPEAETDALACLGFPT